MPGTSTFTGKRLLGSMGLSIRVDPMLVTQSKADASWATGQEAEVPVGTGVLGFGEGHMRKARVGRVCLFNNLALDVEGAGQQRRLYIAGEYPSA